MGATKKLFENDLFNHCPNCNDKIYRGRLNDQCGMIFYYKIILNSGSGLQSELRVIEDGVRIGNPIADRFNNALLCRSCLLVFFKATQYHPLGKIIPQIFEINEKDVQKKIKSSSKEPFNFKNCFICGNKLDEGYITDYPPGGVMPGTLFHVYFNSLNIGKGREELIAIAEDFYQNFFEAYICNNCFTVAARLERFKPLSEGFWARFIRPSRRVVEALEQRLKRLEGELQEINRLYSVNNKREEYFDKLPYEYLSSISDILDPIDRFQFCPNCGVENSSKQNVCRKCRRPLPSI
ncbi:MAG: hypothetical protein OdinLCB4_003535 [Candidatus Odinarchaeum yellowstonii]|uniref:Uncharacterized protein n=1 Tax=Odinarchaeota yellowstonii (strain LCB_4) TaxID=1841599 RepID=A0AAF0D3G4_ODILC|nr:MAG: hypothetical protein OdinLCB4_003535 [Candidatus Odinarchaeum yellowstonii]